MSRLLACVAVLAAACGGSISPAGSSQAASSSGPGGGERRLFLASAVEHPDFTVTLPLYRGTSKGRTVWYVVLDSSNGSDADAKGVNVSQKLAHAAGTGAAQQVTRDDHGVVEFPATVEFGKQARDVRPGPTGFPPAAAVPSDVGEPGYSPLAEFPDGTVENAPHVANDTGRHPKVVAINAERPPFTVTLRETPGFSGGMAVRYVSTDASLEAAAALEEAVLAPALDLAPTAGEDGTDQARASLAAFVNGRTIALDGDPANRQGLNSALLDGESPLNVLRWSPNQGRYSPLWDVHLARWTDEAKRRGLDLRQTDFGDVLGLASHGLVTAPDGGRFGASGFIVNCPIISSD